MCKQNTDSSTMKSVNNTTHLQQIPNQNTTLNSLPNDRILDCSKLKTMAQ